MLVRVGGPAVTAPPKPVPLPGEVVARDAAGQQFTASMGNNGRFELSLPVGTYRLTGHSPQVPGETRRASRSVRVTASKPLHNIWVVCSIPLSRSSTVNCRLAANRRSATGRPCHLRARTGSEPGALTATRGPSEPGPTWAATGRKRAGTISCAVSHPVVPHPRTGHVKITRIGRGIADGRTSTGAARPVSME